MWVYGARACAQGGPVECTPAQVTWIPTALTRTPSQGTEAERDASIQAAEAQGAPPDPSVFDSVHARDVEHSVSPVAQVAKASGGGSGGDTAATAAASTPAAGASPLELLAASTAAAASTPKHHHNKEAKLLTGTVAATATVTSDGGEEEDEEEEEGGGPSGVFLLIVAAFGAGSYFYCRLRKAPAAAASRENADLPQAGEDGLEMGEVRRSTSKKTKKKKGHDQLVDEDL